MTITLPSSPGYQSHDIHQIDFGGVLTPLLGGEQQRINRLGSRWGLTVRLPRMKLESQRRTWIAALSQGLQEGVMLRFPQVDFVNDVTGGGSTLVNGANQIGSTLNIDGITPGKIAKYGQFFSVPVAGERFVYMVAADTTANASGQMALPIFPMIRKSPADNSACEFGAPFLQGFLQDNRPSWTVDIARTVGLEFTVLERA